MTDSTAVNSWVCLLPRLRLVDLGPGATFGRRHVAKWEGLEVYRARPSDGGQPVLHVAAALLHVVGVTPETPTHEVRDILQREGLGPPYGREYARVAEHYRRARELLGLTGNA